MHERSETTQDPLTMLWMNVFGKGTPQAGLPLPPRYPFESGTYPDVQAAVAAAKQRSQMEGGVGASLSDLIDFHSGPQPSLISGGLRKLSGQEP